MDIEVKTDNTQLNELVSKRRQMSAIPNHLKTEQKYYNTNCYMDAILRWASWCPAGVSVCVSIVCSALVYVDCRV